MKITLSNPAAGDLRAIWDYIGLQNGNPEAADRVLKSISETMKMLSRFPKIGVSCDEYAKFVASVHSVSIEGYVIYYRIVDDGIQIGRVIHSRVDREAVFMRWFLDEADGSRA